VDLRFTEPCPNAGRRKWLLQPFYCRSNGREYVRLRPLVATPGESPILGDSVIGPSRFRIGITDSEEATRAPPRAFCRELAVARSCERAAGRPPEGWRTGTHEQELIKVWEPLVDGGNRGSSTGKACASRRWGQGWIGIGTAL